MPKTFHASPQSLSLQLNANARDALLKNQEGSFDCFLTLTIAHTPTNVLNSRLSLYSYFGSIHSCSRCRKWTPPHIVLKRQLRGKQHDNSRHLKKKQKTILLWPHLTKKTSKLHFCRCYNSLKPTITLWSLSARHSQVRQVGNWGSQSLDIKEQHSEIIRTQKSTF